MMQTDDYPTGTVDDWINDQTSPTGSTSWRREGGGSVHHLAAQLDDAPVAAAGAPPPPGDGLDPPDEPPSDPPSPSASGGRKGRPKGEIWEGCPVKPLGVNNAISFYLDVHGQMRAVAKHDAQTIMHLFGNRIPSLCWHFPQWSKDVDTGEMKRKINRFEATNAAMDMIAACSERGLFDPVGSVRGVGAWADDDGKLVYHTGDKLILHGRSQEPSGYQGRIYPAFPPIPHPADSADGPDPMPDLLALLETWQWHRPTIDPFVTTGMIGVQMMGGALDWRPAYWLTGPPAAGKSALQRLMLWLHGGEKGLIQSPDATARGIASLLGQSTVPIALDELEPGDAGSTKERQIIETARVAASGGRWVRGSSDQTGSSGNLRSTFLFSSVLIPGVLKSQDLQRIITLNLSPFPEGAKAPPMRAETWRKRGAVLKRMIIDRWPSWTERLDLWREAFAEHRITGRNADNWATTMAMAQMMQSEDLPSAEELAGWTRKIADLITADLSEMSTDSDEVLMHLLTSPYEVFRSGEQYTLAQWLMVAAMAPGAPDTLLGDFSTDQDGKERRAAAANSKLAKAAIKVIHERGRESRLFIGNAKVAPLLKIFEGTQWAGGAWKQSLERVKGAQLGGTPRTLAGIRSRGVEIPLSSIPGLGFFPQDRDHTADAQSQQPPNYSEEFA